MSINLQKRTEKVGIVLAKRGITKVPSTRVGVVLDVSGSAEPLYRNGVIQETLDRLLGVAVKFDDNGELDAWLFDTSVFAMPTITEADEGTYVKKAILGKNLNIWNGTSYAPPLRATMDHYFPKQGVQQAASAAKSLFGGLFGKKEAAPAPVAATSKQDPAMVLFVTDGANNDPSQAAAVLREAAKSSPVYFMMVGVGPSSYFSFLKEMADELPNVGFVSLSSLSMTEDQLYEEIVNPEFCEWIKKLA